MPTNYTNYTNFKKSITENSELLYKEEVFRIIGAALEVHRTLGSGFLEPVYQEALEIEFALQKIPFQPQVPLKIQYKDRILEKHYIADYYSYEKILVEIKAVQNLSPEHIAQVINYLQATQFKLGLLINFGAKSLEWKRIVN